MKPFSYGSSDGWRHMYNIDGFMTLSSSSDIRVISKYNQLFRNGIYEIYSANVFFETFHRKMGFEGSELLNSTIEHIQESLRLLEQINIDPPFYIAFSFRNVKGKIMNRDGAFVTPEFTKDNIDFPFIQIPSYDANIKNLMKPNFDILWQIFGYAKSPLV